jgi:hypothetical protein
MECASDFTLATSSAITDAATYPQNLTDYDPIFTDIDYLQNLLNNDRRKGNPGHRVFIDPKDPDQQFLVPITTFRFPGSTKDELKKGVCKPEELTREDKFIEKIYVCKFLVYMMFDFQSDVSRILLGH